MKKIVSIIFVFVLTFVGLFGDNPRKVGLVSPREVIAAEPSVLTTDDDIWQEFEEYPVEDYFEGTYIETECQDCLVSAEMDCLEVHSDCFDLPDCSDWLTCVGWCEAYEGDDDCYTQCDDSFIDSHNVQVSLQICTCELCGMKCRALCGVEGY